MITLPATFLSFITELKSHKDKQFGSSITIFNYYVKASPYCPIPNDFPVIPKTSLKKLVQKQDTAASFISTRAINAYISALMPIGIQSITISFEKLLLRSGESKTASIYKNIKELETLYTDFTQNHLSDEKVRFTTAINGCMADYINYGNAILRTSINVKEKTQRFKHIPFTNAQFLESDIGNVLHYTEERLVFDLYSSYPKYKEIQISNKIQDKISTIFLPKTMIDNVMDLSTYQGFDNNSLYIEVVYHDQTKSILDVVSHKDYHPFFIAKMHETGGAGQYGTGDGLLSIGAIIDNEYSAFLIDEVRKQQVAPPLKISANAIITSSGLDFNLPTLQGGTITRVERDAGSNGQLDPDPLIEPMIEAMRSWQLFLESKALATKGIQDGYHFDLFTMDAEKSERTAFEVNERKLSSSRQYRSKNAPFDDYLYKPAIRQSTNFLIDTGQIPRKTIKEEIAKAIENGGKKSITVKDLEDFVVKTFTFETQQIKDIKISNAERYLNIVAGVQQAELAEDEKAKIAQASYDLLE